MSVSLYGSGNTIIQAVNNTAQTNGTYFSTSSSSLVSTGFSVTITPQSTTSKVLVMVSASCNGSSGNGEYTIYRNSTNLATGTAPSIMTTTNSNGTGCQMVWLDSPSTTSATTYTVYACTGSSTYFGFSSGASNSNAISIVALEVSGS